MKTRALDNMRSFSFSGCFITGNFRAAEVAPPAEMEEMFEKYAEGRTHMTGSSCGDSCLRKNLTFDDFHHYLFSPELNPPIGNQQVVQDMTSPLSHYFIYTGHNSYLTGNQLSSHSSDIPIIKSLKKGVRAIELDLWPNSSKNDVLVLHGRTLTTPVKLIKCLKAIKEYAFSASPYPVIVTLEDHLTADLQAKVAQMITQIFGDMLYYSESEGLKELPSPEELKYRIIISTKPPKEKLESKSINGRKHKRKDSNGEDVSKKEQSNLTSNQADDHEKSEHNNHSDEYNECKSRPLSEDKFKRASVSYGTDVVRFTQKSFLRIFPKQTRFNSSNYNPITGWIHGAQMVAFNMQGHGKYLWLMQGMFRANAGCGYVKKPDFITNVGPDGQVFNPKEKVPVKKTLKVKVYVGDGWHSDFNRTQFKCWSPPQFYTRIGIAGVSADKTMKKTKKRVVGNWGPVWDEEFAFPLTVPELALLRVEVCKYDMSEQDDFAGQTCLPVFQLRPGIRAVPLYDRKGEKFGSVRLLMRFELV
ncbi:hypothetical protein LWI29_009546 [Acer saccharum]|uniref:Phosphoinositide phospholipase C n=1 Tax=Acer saccharum TaxID=4024 RepID=A0AA39W5V0_ACESA|nr:hypothetical protein LWI29_009546 [Acer saccharum]